MKSILSIFVLLLLLCGGCSKSSEQTVDISKVIERDRITYLIRPDGSSDEPFTGVVVSKYENGQLKQKVTYKNGKKDGPYKFYYENGMLEVDGVFKDEGRGWVFESYNENGQLEQKGTFRDGKENGIFENYDENGQLSLRHTYKNGRQDGLFEAFYDNGQVLMRKNYKDGIMDGVAEMYDENGLLMARDTYTNGKQITSETYNKKGDLIERDEIGQAQYDGEHNATTSPQN